MQIENTICIYYIKDNISVVWYHTTLLEVLLQGKKKKKM
jgi:hypothetical protein